MKIKHIFFGLLITSLLVTISQAGVVMVSEVNSGGKTSINKAYVENNKLRVDSKDARTDTTMIFRGDKKLMWMIQNNKKTYHEMTEADIKKMKSKMDGAMKKMEAQMKNMPPAQRKMMKGQTVREITYKKVASNQKVGKWNCDKYAVLENGARVATVWTTKWRSFGIGSGDFKVFDSLSNMMKNNMPSGYSLDYKPFSRKSGLNGVPVKRVGKNGGWVMKEIKKQGINNSKFNLPGGLTKKDL